MTETKSKSAATVTKLIMIKQSANEKTENFNMMNERKFINLRFNIEKKYMRSKIRQKTRQKKMMRQLSTLTISIKI